MWSFSMVWRRLNDPRSIQSSTRSRDYRELRKGERPRQTWTGRNSTKSLGATHAHGKLGQREVEPSRRDQRMGRNWLEPRAQVGWGENCPSRRGQPNQRNHLASPSGLVAQLRILILPHVSTITRRALQAGHSKRHREGTKTMIFIVRNAKHSVRSRHGTTYIEIKIILPA